MKLFKHALLILVFGSVAFLLGCGEDDGTTLPQVVAAFTSEVDQTTGAVTFTNTSENATTYSWDFGDGATSSQENPVKTYTENGDYEVSLTASNDAGASDNFSATITIALEVPSVEDTEAPTIMLNGNAEVTIALGDTYTDAGATADDNVDGEITDDIVVGGDTVDPLSPGTYTVTYTVADAAGNSTTVSRTITVTFDGGLVANGDFNNGTTGWSGNALDVRTEGGNSFNFADVGTAGNAFDVNLSYVLEITDGSTYELSFTASTATGTRTMLAGIGLNEGAFTSATETVTLTSTNQLFTYELTASGFGSANSRVLFDMGADVGIVVIDNVSLVETSSGGGGGGSKPESFPINFEDDLALEGAFDNGATGSVETNPDQSGINTSSKVYQFTKVVGSAWYSGAFNVFSADFDPADGDLFKLKIWSPNAGINVRFQLEKEGNQGPIVTYSVDETLATANTWVEMSFDFSATGLDLADGYDKIVIQPDYDESNMVDVSTQAIYYIDDITQEPSCSTPAMGEYITNGDWETGNACGWTDVGGLGTFEVSSAQAQAGTYSGRMTVGESQTYTLRQSNLAMGTITTGSSVTVSFDVFGANGAGGVMSAQLQSQIDGGGVSNTELLQGNILPTGTWENYSYTVTVAGDVSGGVNLQLDVACGAVTGCNVDAYIDNVSLVIN